MSSKRHIPNPVYELSTTPFSSAEEAWFWFVRCQRVRRDGARFSGSSGGIRRPCDPDDLYRAAISLSRQGIIRSQHLSVLGRYGLQERPPDPRYRHEQSAFKLWDEALDRLTSVLRQKGIVERQLPSLIRMRTIRLNALQKTQRLRSWSLLGKPASSG